MNHVCVLIANPRAPHGHAYECEDCKRRYYCTPELFATYLKGVVGFLK